MATMSPAHAADARSLAETLRLAVAESPDRPRSAFAESARSASAQPGAADPKMKIAQENYPVSTGFNGPLRCMAI
jgi:hypothetical protein